MIRLGCQAHEHNRTYHTLASTKPTSQTHFSPKPNQTKATKKTIKIKGEIRAEKEKEKEKENPGEKEMEKSPTNEKNDPRKFRSSARRRRLGIAGIGDIDRWARPMRWPKPTASSAKPSRQAWCEAAFESAIHQTIENRPILKSQILTCRSKHIVVT